MRCYSCGGQYDSDAMTCPFCGQRNFIERVPGTEEEIKGEDLFVARKTRSFQMFVNIADRLVKKVLRIEKIIIGVMILGILVLLLAMPVIGAVVRFVKKDSYLAECTALHKQEQFAALAFRIRETGCFDKEGFEQYTEMALLYEEYMEFCGARMAYQEDIIDGELESWTIRDLAREMSDLFSDLHLSRNRSEYRVPTHAANDPYREQYRQDAIMFARVILKLTDEELARFEIINCYDLEDTLRKAIEEMR